MDRPAPVIAPVIATVIAPVIAPVIATMIAPVIAPVMALCFALGCAAGGHDVRPGSDGGRLDAAADGSMTTDGARPGTDSGARVDAHVPPGTDGGRADAATPRDAGRPGALDPLLSPASASGSPCSTPGSMGECPGIAVCRFYTASEGRCESCSECGNLGAPCSSGTDCDILFACYAGRCTNICPLGTFYCGPIEDCLDVGHPTHGVCRP